MVIVFTLAFNPTGPRISGEGGINIVVFVAVAAAVSKAHLVFLFDKKNPTVRTALSYVTEKSPEMYVDEQRPARGDAYLV